LWHPTGKAPLSRLEAGATDYIRKPFDPIEIQARVKSMVRLNLELKRNNRLEKEKAATGNRKR
jgi:DNA-binding response OmpR family regulator